MIVNNARIVFDARSENEGFARMVVMGFMVDMNPTMDELQDVKTAVSEAVTNAIIHGYEGRVESRVEMECKREDQLLTVIVTDYGIGIPNVEEARLPFYTTKPEEERSGMGFSFMETFMDEIEVASELDKGTCITMRKYIEGGVRDK